MIAGGFKSPALANPGNIIDCGCAGGGNIGDEFSHEGEAPFPEKLADFMVRTFCPAGGCVFDPFIGSGTTAKVASKTGRRFIGVDIRADQIALTQRRLAAS